MRSQQRKAYDTMPCFSSTSLRLTLRGACRLTRNDMLFHRCLHRGTGPTDIEGAGYTDVMTSLRSICRLRETPGLSFEGRSIQLHQKKVQGREKGPRGVGSVPGVGPSLPPNIFLSASLLQSRPSGNPQLSVQTNATVILSSSCSRGARAWLVLLTV